MVCVPLYIVNKLKRSVIHRYSAVPPFGIDAIHHFPPDAAEMMQKTARHFEDMLQVRTFPVKVVFYLHGTVCDPRI